MTREELLERLQSIEWDDIEFKEAAWAGPKDALSSVSAFANAAQRLAVQVILETADNAPNQFVLAEHLRARFQGEAGDQPETQQVTETGHAEGAYRLQPAALFQGPAHRTITHRRDSEDDRAGQAPLIQTALRADQGGHQTQSLVCRPAGQYTTDESP